MHRLWGHLGLGKYPPCTSSLSRNYSIHVVLVHRCRHSHVTASCHCFLFRDHARACGVAGCWAFILCGTKNGNSQPLRVGACALPAPWYVDVAAAGPWLRPPARRRLGRLRRWRRKPRADGQRWRLRKRAWALPGSGPVWVFVKTNKVQAGTATANVRGGDGDGQGDHGDCRHHWYSCCKRAYGWSCSPVDSGCRAPASPRSR